MILIIVEWKDSKVHIFEVELLVYTGKSQLDPIRSQECYSVEEVLELINELHINNLINYKNLTLDYNNKKYSYVKNQENLLTLIHQNLLI